MRITWVTRSFLDYRVPVYKALDDLCGHHLTVIYYGDIPPERTQTKLRAVLGDRAIARQQELRIGNKPKIDNASLGNTSFRIPISPGLIKQVIDSKPDVLLSDGFMQWTYAALAVRALEHVPHVMCYERTAHTERNAGRCRIMYRKFVSRWIDAICCNGRLCGEYVKQLGFDPARLTYGHMAADVDGMRDAVERLPQTVADRLRMDLNVKGVMMLYVGQLVERKGVEELLCAWKTFAKKNVDATLVCVGGGALENKLRERIAKENIPNVILAGAVDYDSITAYYKAADCFIIATKEDNWSLVVPEAMACELPVACSQYNGCWPELVTERNGWVFDPLDEKDIVGTLQRVVDCAPRLKAMGGASREIVSTHTARHAAQAIMDAINIAQRHCQ